jgi:hypothetical protein
MLQWIGDWQDKLLVHLALTAGQVKTARIPLRLLSGWLVGQRQGTVSAVCKHSKGALIKHAARRCSSFTAGSWFVSREQLRPRRGPCLAKLLPKRNRYWYGEPGTPSLGKETWACAHSTAWLPSF